MIIILSVFAVFGVILPVTLFVGAFVKETAKLLSVIGCETFGVQLIFHSICIFTAIFGFHVVLNEFYFSNDIEFILPWPLRASQVIAAKFSAAFLGENVIQFLFLAACVVGFGLGAGMNLLGCFMSVVGVFTLTILPMVYCAVISMVLMCFTGLVRNKDIIQKITLCLVFVFLLAILAGAGFLQNMDIQGIVVNMASGKKNLFSVLDIIFPQVPLMIKSMQTGSIVSFVLYLFLQAAAIGIMLLLAELLYTKGLMRLSSLPESKKVKNLDQIIGKCKKHSPAYSYFMKEVKLLMRTPAFFSHSIVVNFIWPVFVFASYQIQSKKVTVEFLTKAYAKEESGLPLFCVVFVVGVSAFLASLNSISSNAISREGKGFSFMKYIPVSYQTQWNVKTLVGILFAAAGVLVYMIPAFVLIKVPLLHILCYLLLCLLSVTFVSYMGIYIDSIQPKLVWDDEMSALRENYNMFYSMAIVIAFVAVVCVGGYLFFLRKHIFSFAVLGFLYTAFLLAANGVMYLLMKRSGVRNISEQEEV